MSKITVSLKDGSTQESRSEYVDLTFSANCPSADHREPFHTFDPSDQDVVRDILHKPKTVPKAAASADRGTAKPFIAA